jgi:hypothetical protein
MAIGFVRVQIDNLLRTYGAMKKKRLTAVEGRQSFILLHFYFIGLYSAYQKSVQ